MLVFMGWQFVGVLWSGHKFNSISVSLIWVLMFFGFLFVSNLINSKERLEEVLFASTLCGGVAGAVGIGQMILFHYGDIIAAPLKTGLNPFWRSLDLFLAKLCVYKILPANIVEILPQQLPFYTDNRANATFSNPVFFACFMIMVLPFAVYCFFYLKDKRKKWISLACTIVIVCGLALSYSRAPYLALGITAFVLLFMGRKQAFKILATTPVLLFLLPSGVYKRLLTLLNTNDVSITTRTSVWDICIETLKKKWVFGMGPGVENVRGILYSLNPPIYQPHAHNVFLQLFLEGGIFGVSVFFALIIWVIAGLMKLCIRSKEGRPLGVALLASFAGFLTCGITDYVLYGPKILQYFMMILGLTLAAKKIYLPKTAGDMSIEFENQIH